MFAVLVSLLLVVLVNVEGLKPCDAPEVWNARSMTIDPSKNYTVFSKLSYDAIDERLSMDEMVYLQAQKERMFYKFIFLYKEQVLYQLRMENMTEKCIKNDLTEPFKKIQVPKNATSMGDLTIGSNAEPGLGVNIAVFAGKTPEGVSLTWSLGWILTSSCRLKVADRRNSMKERCALIQEVIRVIFGL
ncbi:mammalian ependymin-related protein 1-like isoform X2 [Montipora foliosa]|uniref:mammalian ependymin-related protein 1-like isoform X2 n=1 Tax=Montipora foliosa TaxID=591990 RepID=UPI0035F1CFCD